MNPAHFGPILDPDRQGYLSKPFYLLCFLTSGLWRSSASYGFSQNLSRTGTLKPLQKHFFQKCSKSIVFIDWVNPRGYKKTIFSFFTFLAAAGPSMEWSCVCTWPLWTRTMCRYMTHLLSVGEFGEILAPPRATMGVW